LGAAFCRNTFIDQNECHLGTAELLRPTAGILAGFLETIAFSNCISFPSMVVRRCVYEKLGGFRLDLPFAADWQMWIRIAAHYLIWYEPATLAACRLHATSATAGFISSGESDVDMLRCIETSRPLLPPNRAESILRHARELFYLRSILRTSQDDTALRLVEELTNVLRSGPVHRSAVANAMLRAAHIHYRQGRLLQALLFVTRAVMTRPLVVGRPLKRALNSLFRKSQAEASQP
jgi:hypothetical protein